MNFLNEGFPNRLLSYMHFCPKFVLNDEVHSESKILQPIFILTIIDFMIFM